jgi:glutathione synthase/RimK-type ligase-like ATP-grasp enzyme
VILVCGGLADVVTELVCARLEDLRYPYRLLNLGFYPDGYRVTWTWNGGVPSGRISCSDWELDLDDVSGVFVRGVELEAHAPFSTIPTGLEGAALGESQAALTAMLEHLRCPVANRVTGSWSNNSKPYQALHIRAVGLAIPRTLITSDPAAARAFYEECRGEVIFKSLSGERSIVRRMEPRDLDRLHLLRSCVAQFQAYVPGDNIRVHTVGDRLFATRARTAAVDYRYAGAQGHELEMESTTLPPAIIEACHQLADVFGLLIAGIDLKQTKEDEWYCFEVNPSPGFSFYELHTGQPISAALADELRAGIST